MVRSNVIVQTLSGQLSPPHDSAGAQFRPPTIALDSATDRIRMVSRLNESLPAFASLRFPLLAFLFMPSSWWMDRHRAVVVPARRHLGRPLPGRNDTASLTPGRCDQGSWAITVRIGARGAGAAFERTFWLLELTARIACPPGRDLRKDDNSSVLKGASEAPRSVGAIERAHQCTWSYIQPQAPALSSPRRACASGQAEEPTVPRGPGRRGRRGSR
jgi:hypothetical protein